MSKVIMNIEQLKYRMKKLASSNSYYWNSYPYNLCYVHADGRISSDCNNLYKSILNGYDVDNRTPGYFQKDLSNTGDCDEWGLIQQCTDITSDFTRLEKESWAPRILYKEGHIGGFLGEIVTMNGDQYNTVEATPWYGDWDGGIIFSWTDTDGTRRTHKGGNKNGKWELNGLMTTWVDYSSGLKPDPVPEKCRPSVRVLKRGMKGDDVKSLQSLLNLWTTQSGTYKPIIVDGDFGENTENRLKLYQQIEGLTRDGICGEHTWSDILS